MAKITLYQEPNKQQVNIDLNELMDLNKEDELTNFVAPQFDHNMGFNIDQQKVSEFDNTIPENNKDIVVGEDLEYSHASNANNDEYELGEEKINAITNNISERIKYYMPGSVEVAVKKKCTIGGNGDGTSTACNQGDVNNLILTPIPAENKETKNIPNQLHEDESNDIDYENKLIELQKKFPDYDLRYDKSLKFKNSYIGTLYKNDEYLYGLKGPVSIKQLYDFYYNILNKNKINEDDRNNNPKYEYNALMLYFDIPNWNKITSFINKNDLCDNNDLVIEQNPHVTLSYGFDNISVDEIFELYKAITKIEPITVILKGIQCFENNDNDVLSFIVESRNLIRFHRYLNELPHINNEKNMNYVPHMTIAYLKKGTGNKYCKLFKNDKFITSNKLVFSDKGENETILNLNNNLNIKDNITESPDGFNINGTRASWESADAIPFTMINGYNDKIFIGDKSETHLNLIHKYNLSPKLILLRDSEFINDGRIWMNKKIISFWKYPSQADYKNFIINLGKALNIDIWNDPDYKLEIEHNNKQELIPIQQYSGSVNPPESEKLKHLQSPMEKKNVNVPQGVGSKKYLEKKPLEYQQALHTSESVIKSIIYDILKEDTDGQPEKQIMSDVKYVDQSSMKNEKCSSCGWFNINNNNQCGMVEGNINPEGWCKLWGTKKFCNENLIRNIIKKEILIENKSKYSETKDALINSKSISKEVKNEILKYLTSGSSYKLSKHGNGGFINGLIKPKEFTEKTSKSSGVSLGADNDGFYCYTHRARSKSYEIPGKIPIKDIEFIESTG